MTELFDKYTEKEAIKIIIERLEKYDTLERLEIPKEVLHDPRFNRTDKIIFGYVYGLARSKQGCFAGNDYLSELIGVHQTKISKALTCFEKAGLIIMSFDGRKRMIHMNKDEGLVNPLGQHKYFNYGRLSETAYIIEENNTIDIISNSKELTKSTFEKSALDESKELKQNPLIDFWNDLPNTSKHKSRSTKIYKKITAHLNQLKSGVFTKRNKLDSDFLQRNNITNGLLSKQYTTSELREGLLRLSNMLTEGYWPSNKKSLSKSLQLLLYNPHTGSSMFLKVMKTPPEQLSKSKSKRPVDKNIDMTESLLERNLINLVDLSNRQITTMFKHLQAIKDYHTEALEHDRFGNKHIRYEQPHKLLDDYLKWIEDQDWLEGFKLNLLNIENKPWKLFTKWASDCIGEQLN